MREKSLKMVGALIRNCCTNEKNASNMWEKLLWENTREGLEYIQDVETKEATRETE